jgi:hypothetical protein
MTEHHNAEEDAYNSSSRDKNFYELDNLSARDSDEANREDEMFRVMQLDDREDGNRASLRENIEDQRKSEAPTKPSSPGPAAAVAVPKPNFDQYTK